MTANKKNQEFKIRKIRRNIEYSFRDSTDILICLLFSLLPELFYGQLCTLFSMSVLIHGWPTRNYLISSICGMF